MEATILNPKSLVVCGRVSFLCFPAPGRITSPQCSSAPRHITLLSISSIPWCYSLCVCMLQLPMFRKHTSHDVTAHSPVVWHHLLITHSKMLLPSEVTVTSIGVKTSLCIFGRQPRVIALTPRGSTRSDLQREVLLREQGHQQTEPSWKRLGPYAHENQ